MFSTLAIGRTKSQGVCVWQKKSDIANIQIFELPDGAFIGLVQYQTKDMAKPMHFETKQADNLPQAQDFAYFIMREASENF